VAEERQRRRSRVLEYFEQQQADTEATEENPESGGDESPFQDFDSAFGLDYFDSKGNE
jgi:hypothetical protein